MNINWNYILEKMKNRKITNTQMAELLDVNRDTWNKWKSEKTDITLKKFYRILEILDLEFNDVIIDSPIMEYRKYYKEASFFDPDALEARMKKIDDEVAILETKTTEEELKEYEEICGLFGHEKMFKIAKGCIEHNKLYDEIYKK